MHTKVLPDTARVVWADNGHPAVATAHLQGQVVGAGDHGAFMSPPLLVVLGWDVVGERYVTVGL